MEAFSIYSPIWIDPLFLASAKDGLLKYSFILTTAGANQNKQVFLDEDLRDPNILASIIGEPIDIDHGQAFSDIVGEIYDAEYLPETSYGRPSAIKAYATIFEDIYPDVAMKLRRGAGKWAAMSMEAIPQPLQRQGEYLIIHKPKFVGAGIVRFPGNVHSQIEDIFDSRHEKLEEVLLLKASLKKLTEIY